MADNNVEVLVRRATPDDYEAVLDINHNVYNGLDYLPTIYRQLIDSKAKYAAYVAQLDDKLVAFASYGMQYSNNVSSILALRVRPGYEGRGYTRLLRQQLLRDFPNITHFVYDGFITPASALKLKKCQLLAKSNVLIYYVDGTLLSTWLKSHSSLRQQLTTSELTNDESRKLISSGQCRRLLSKFAIDYIISGHSVWEPVGYNDDQMMIDRLTQLRTAVSYQEESQTNKLDKELQALSICSDFVLKTRENNGRVECNLFFYGDDAECLIHHVLDHVLHLASTACRRDETVTDGCRDTFLYVHAPEKIDKDHIDSLIRASPQQPQPQQLITGLDFMKLLSTGDVYMALESATRTDAS